LRTSLTSCLISSGSSMEHRSEDEEIVTLVTEVQSKFEINYSQGYMAMPTSRSFQGILMECSSAVTLSLLRICGFSPGWWKVGSWYLLHVEVQPHCNVLVTVYTS
jgi:hypothetical protein